jgi:hypothetical protein
MAAPITSESKLREKVKNLIRPGCEQIASAMSEEEKQKFRRETIVWAQSSLAKQGIHISKASLNSSVTATLINMDGKRGKRSQNNFKPDGSTAQSLPETFHKMPITEEELRAKRHDMASTPKIDGPLRDHDSPGKLKGGTP